MRLSRWRAASAAVAVALTLVVSMMAAAPAFARSGPKAIWGPAQVNGVDQFPVYQRLGVTIWNVAVSWPTVDNTRPADPTNPADPAYDWTPGLAGQIQEAARYGIRTMIELRDAPAWANGGKPVQWAPTNPDFFADFAEAASREYATVHLWMIYGEPNQRANFMPEAHVVDQYKKTLTPVQAAAPRRYAQILDASYGALKRVSAANLVIGGDSYTAGDIPPFLWIKYLRLPDGQPPRMDMYGHNPFTVRAPNLKDPPLGADKYDFSDLGRLYFWVNKNLAPTGHKLKLFLAEWTIPTAPDIEFNYFTTLAVQAQWIRDGLAIVRSHPQWIYALGWIHVRDRLPTTAGGLEFANGRPKPGFFAFANG